jgi:hypothetical protein
MIYIILWAAIFFAELFNTTIPKICEPIYPVITSYHTAGFYNSNYEHAGLMLALLPKTCPTNEAHLGSVKATYFHPRIKNLTSLNEV